MLEKAMTAASQSTPAHRIIIRSIVILIGLMTPSLARASFVANFDSLQAGGLSGGLSGAPVVNYLASFGITLSNVSAGTALTVYDSRVATKVVPSSPYNVIGQAGSLDPISYTLNFATSQDFFAMTRVGIVAGSTGTALPYWRASAYDASGVLLGSVGENAFSIYSDISAKTFTLNGPGLKSVVIASDNGHFAALGSVILDDFTFSSMSVPEPSSLVLAVLGCASVFGRRAIGRRRSAP